jgi:hypothetical protein
LFYELTNTGYIIAKEDIRKAIELVNPEFPEVMIEEFTMTYLPIYYQFCILLHMIHLQFRLIIDEKRY